MLIDLNDQLSIAHTSLKWAEEIVNRQVKLDHTDRTIADLLEIQIKLSPLVRDLEDLLSDFYESLEAWEV